VEISQNSNQESSLPKLQNITQLVSRIKFNKIAKYHQNWYQESSLPKLQNITKIGIKNQVYQNCKISPKLVSRIKFDKIENNAPKQKKIKTCQN